MWPGNGKSLRAILMLNNEGNTGNYYWLCSVHAAAAVQLSVMFPKCSTKQQAFFLIL